MQLPNDAQWLPRLPIGGAASPFDDEDDLPREAGGLPDGVRVVQAMPLADDQDEAPWT